MEKKNTEDKETLTILIKQAIELLVEKNLSSVVILSSYKINSILKDHYAVDIKVDIIGRILSNLAKRNNLKRLSTNIPKYKLFSAELKNFRWN
ncbi:MAG: hypothetical protein ACTSRI_11250 [Promethearchaeota archaeon]